jgi:hypothetical protein
MALPASLTVVTLRGTYLAYEGSPGVGTITVYSDEHLVSTVDNTIVGPVNYEVELDANGYFELAVPATNDPQWGPVNFTYTVKETLTTGVRTYRIAVPYDTAGGILDLADVSPVQGNPAPTTYVLVSTANQLGGYPRIDASTGKIPSSVIPAGGGDADGSFKGTWSGATAYIAGDIVIRSGVTYGAIQAGTNQDPTIQTAYWTALPGSAAGVSSFNTRTGAVVPASGDYAIADVTGLTAALNAKAPLASPALTGSPTVGGQAIVATNDSRLSDARTPTAHAASHGVGQTDAVTVAQSQVTGLVSGLAAKADLVGGKLSTSQVPDLAITQYLGSVASQAAMLALTGQIGDWVIRSDLGTVFLITGSDPTILGNWTQLAYPASPVVSVAGRTGAVVLAVADVSGAAPLASPAFTGRVRDTFVTLTDGATVAVNGALGNRFDLTITGDHTLGNPGNAVDMQPFFYRIRQDGTGGHIMLLGNKYRDPNGYYTGLSTAAGDRAYLGVQYDSTDDMFDVLAFGKGY